MRSDTATTGVWRVAGLVVGMLAVGSLVTWLLGGFGPAAVESGRAAALGEEIGLRRWLITVEHVECVDFVPGRENPAVRVALRITNTTKASLGYLPERMVTVRIGSTEIVGGSAPLEQVRGVSAYDPDVEARLEFDYRTMAPAARPATVTVVVRDERDRANFVLSDNWQLGGPAALVEAPCPPVTDR